MEMSTRRLGSSGATRMRLLEVFWGAATEYQIKKVSAIATRLAPPPKLLAARTKPPGNRNDDATGDMAIARSEATRRSNKSCAQELWEDASGLFCSWSPGVLKGGVKPPHSKGQAPFLRQDEPFEAQGKLKRVPSTTRPQNRSC